MKLSSQTKLDIVKKVLRHEISVTQAAIETKTARKTIYAWIKRFQQAPLRTKSKSLEGVYVKGKVHPRSYHWQLKTKLIQLITTKPDLSITQLAKTLKTGRHALYNLLKELSLTTPKARQNFARLYNGPGRLHLDIKAQVVREILEEGQKITSVCRQWHLSRQTIYKWLKQYRADGHVTENYLSGFAHPRALTASTHKKVLNYVAAFPELSIHKLALKVNLSSHGLWKILKINHLTHKNARLTYASSHLDNIPNLMPVIDRVKSVWETFTPNIAPAPPPKILPVLPVIPKTHPSLPKLPKSSLKRILILLNYLYKIVAKLLLFSVKYPFAQAKPIVAGAITFCEALIFSGLAIFAFSYIRIYLYSPTVVVSFGYLFASLALLFGLFFFVYSFKYYISVTLVLSFSRRLLMNEDKTVLSNEQLASAKNGLLPDVSQVILTRHPFVSIHIPFYNEKRVVNRLLEAATSIDYDNYEIIVCDDSTDETKEIVSEWKNHPRVKISHRENREGYKGGALKEALKLMNPQTEFILVFDADFMPFPDSVSQFIKYFQVTIGSLEQKKYAESKVAAVQGYQWHVLNKSENWITRGVRTEYAGSYVIERSSAEIYGGLKQISGSVFMIRADILKGYGWGTSITEDFQLTLRLYEDGFKVVYTPYIQAPSECVSTLKRLIRQRMRWAEGHSYNVKKMYFPLLISPYTTKAEKLEFLYLAPYYLQSLFLVLGTYFWFISEVIFKVRLPFWTAVWGWSLVLTNLLSLPLMNLVGMFLEEAEEKDYSGIIYFVILTYVITPFQAYASVKGFLESKEGPWFRTPKTGRITDSFRRGRFAIWLNWIFGKPTPIVVQAKMQTNAPERRAYSVFLPFRSLNRSQPGMAFAPQIPSTKKQRRLLVRSLIILCLLVTYLTTNLLYPHFMPLGNLFQMVVPQDLQLAETKTNFGYEEQPTFNLHIGDRLLENINKNKSLTWGPIPAYAATNTQVSNRVLYRNEAIKVETSVEQIDSDQYHIKIKPPNNFKPGKYTLETTIFAANKSYTTTKDFNWGVLALNTTKDEYVPGETIEFGLGVVDDVGRTICDAQLTMTIVVPSHHKTYELSTRNGTIIPSGECARQSVTNIADYVAMFTAKETVEDYQLHVTAKTYNGESGLASVIHIVGSRDFMIERMSFPTRIYPLVDYPVSFTITPQVDFDGKLIERIPNGSFEVTGIASEGLFTNGEINWQVHWIAGKTYGYKYTLHFPEVAPELYTIGPLTTKDALGKLIYTEARPWYIAADAPAHVQSNKNAATSCASLTIAFTGGNNTAHNLIVVTSISSSTTPTVSSVTDTSNNTYQKAIGPVDDGSAARAYIYYAEDIAAGANTVTINYSGTSNCQGAALEYSGLATSSSLDQTSSSTGNSTTLDSGSKTTVQANELIFGNMFTPQAHVYTAGTNFNVRQSGNRHAAEDRTVSATGSYSASATIDSTVNNNWGAAMATFSDTAIPENWVLLVLLSPLLWCGIVKYKKRRKSIQKRAGL